LFFEDAKCPGPEIKSHFGVLENKAFCKFFRSFSDVYFWENTKFVGLYPVFSCAQFLVVYRYLGTFGVNKNYCFLRGFRPFSVDCFWGNSKIGTVVSCFLRRHIPWSRSNILYTTTIEHPLRFRNH
jgi:hypothetical protein